MDFKIYNQMPLSTNENHLCELRIRTEYESGLRSNEHYLSSSENNFPALFSLPLTSSIHYCEDRFRIHFFIRSSQRWFSYIHNHLFIGFITNKHSDQLLVGLLTEHCTGIVTRSLCGVQIPYRPKFFPASFLRLLK